MNIRLLILVMVLSTCLSCERRNSTTQSSITEGELFIRKGLLNGHFQKIDKDKYLAIYENSLWLISDAPGGFSKDKFVFELSAKGGDGISPVLNIEQTRLDAVSLGSFRDLEILFYEWGQKEYDQLYLGQIRRSQDSNDTLWQTRVNLNNARMRPNQYNNELAKSTGINLRQSEFQRLLFEGVFFTINKKFYVLISQDAIYLINENRESTADKMMLHFIRENNEFVNKSFNFSSREYQNFLEEPYLNLLIAKVNIPGELENFPKIRLGQYNEKGNIWVQVLDTKEILSNELLRYQSEFNPTVND